MNQNQSELFELATGMVCNKKYQVQKLSNCEGCRRNEKTAHGKDGLTIKTGSPVFDGVLGKINMRIRTPPQGPFGESARRLAQVTGLTSLTELNGPKWVLLV